MQDPRLQEVVELSHFETRVQVIVWLSGAAFFALFCLIGFIPGPLNDYVEYLCLRLTGHIDSRTIGWCTGIFLFILLMLVALGIAAIPRRQQRSLTEVRFDRLTLLRQQLQAEGFTSGQLGYWTAANWRRLFRWTGVICLLIALSATAMVVGGDRWLPRESGPTRNLDLAAGGPPGTGRVRISASARLDLAFWVSTRHYGAAMLSGDETNIHRLDDRGFQSVRRAHYSETLYVPLTAPAWRPGQPIAVFYQCDVACAVEVTPGAPRLPTPIVVSGLLHGSSMPLYVTRTFEAAGLTVASPYAIIREQETDPQQPFAITALLGFITAMLLLVLPPYYEKSVRRQARKRWTRSGATPANEGQHAPTLAIVAPIPPTSEPTDADHQAPQPADTVPAPLIAFETIDVGGKLVEVREVERSQEYHYRVLTAADGEAYLEYPVSIGSFKLEMPAIHVLSREELAARFASTLDLGKFSVTLSEIAQATGKFNRTQHAEEHNAYRPALLSLLRLVQMEISVLHRMAETKAAEHEGGAVNDQARSLGRLLTHMTADYQLPDAAVFTQAARGWAEKLSSIQGLIDVPFYDAEKDAVEKAIGEVARDLYRGTELPMEITIDRDSVCMADDMEDHRCLLSIAPADSVFELLEKALKDCPLASGGSRVTWTICLTHPDPQKSRLIGMLATQWREPKLVVSSSETVGSLFKEGATGLYFRYRPESDPDADFEAVRATGRLPPPTVASRDTLARIRQINSQFNPTAPNADFHIAHRDGLRALLLLVQMEISVLRQINGAALYADRLAALVPEMGLDVERSDPIEMSRAAGRWANKLGRIYVLVGTRYLTHPLNGDKDAIETSIYSVASQLRRLTVSA